MKCVAAFSNFSFTNVCETQSCPMLSNLEANFHVLPMIASVTQKEFACETLMSRHLCGSVTLIEFACQTLILGENIVKFASEELLRSGIPILYSDISN
jgi:hypothetical protein